MPDRDIWDQDPRCIPITYMTKRNLRFDSDQVWFFDIFLPLRGALRWTPQTGTDRQGQTETNRARALGGALA